MIHVKEFFKRCFGLLLLPVLCVISETAHAQTAFQRIYAVLDATHINNVVPVAGGEYMISGYEGDSTGFYFFARLDSTGQQLWSQRINIPTDTNRGSEIGVTASGGYYLLAGSYVNTEPALSLIVMDSLGVITGNSVFTGTDPGEFSDQVIHQNQAGEFYISSRYMNLTGSYFFLVKADTSASPLWINSFAQAAGDKQHCLDSEIASDGGLISVGGSMFLMGMNIVKTDINGNLHWSKTYTDNMGNLLMATSINETMDGGYIIGGQFTTGTFGYALPLLMKIDAAGNVLWSKYYGNTGSFHVFGLTGAVEAADGSIYASCLMFDGIFSFSNPLLFKTDSSGNFLWAKRYSLLNEVSPVSFHLNKTDDNGLLISATGYDNGNGNTVGYVIKTDSSGNSGCSENVVSLGITTLALNVSSPFIHVPGGNFSSSSLSVSVNYLISSSSCSTILGYAESLSQEAAFEVFPIPATNVLNVTLNRNETVILMNLMGDIIFQKYVMTASGHNEAIDISALPSGIYFIKAGNVVRKFVKE